MRFLLGLASLAACWLGSVNAADWAVIVAGSNGFDNYRHHADVCHAYQIAHEWGIPADNIITMLYDDVASDPSNPFKGKLFNKPTTAGAAGVDVYKGCQKDYTGQDVTAANFLKVLTGDSSAPGKVLTSSSDDNVFINFVDHGATGLVAFPVGNYLYANDLLNALKTMSTNKMYKKLVFYMEACESGSMFENLIPDDLNIYVTTASNADESSWGTYCPPDDEVNGKNVGSCLGDLYSVNWMENSQSAGPNETLSAQFDIVQNLTSLSHVMKYGDFSFVTDPIGAFEGNFGSLFSHRRHHHRHHADDEIVSSASSSTMVSSRDVELHNAYYRYLRAPARSTESRAAQSRLTAILAARQKADDFADQLVRAVVPDTADADTESYFAAPAPAAIAKCDGCCKTAEQAIRDYCGGFSDYSLQYMRVVLNLCDAGQHSHDGTAAIVNAVRDICTSNNYQLNNVARN